MRERYVAHSLPTLINTDAAQIKGPHPAFHCSSHLLGVFGEVITSWSEELLQQKPLATFGQRQPSWDQGSEKPGCKQPFASTKKNLIIQSKLSTSAQTPQTIIGHFFSALDLAVCLKFLETRIADDFWRGGGGKETQTPQQGPAVSQKCLAKRRSESLHPQAAKCVCETSGGLEPET